MEDLEFADPLGALRINPIYCLEEPPAEFSVVVRNAVTPWNFQVTDYCTSKCLETLETRMTEWYGTSEKMAPSLTYDDLVLGGFYAVKYVVDGKPTKWHRCEIVKPFKKELPSVTVKLVDNGAFYPTIPSNFQPLRKSYCTLPIQAMEACLQASDGSKATLLRHLGAEECRKFYERVEGKHFYSFVLNSAKSLNSREILRLILVDTSDADRNIYIHEEFNLKLDQSAG